MAIAQIEGGLGSQMFGYAAARRLALKHGVKVHIDTRNYRTYKKFQPELHHFDVDAILLTDEQADELCGPSGMDVPIVRPAHLHVDRAILELETPHVLMVGNYVSEDYFSDIEDIIRKDFQRVTEPVAYAVAVKQQLDDLEAQGYQPVAVHIRRGDYVNEADVLAFHGTCTRDYYDNAMSLMRRLVDNPYFVFFSNDPEWVKEHFAGPDRLITEAPVDAPPIEDMFLMAACKHQIIANSTYSWWSAWLGKHDDQVVIGPRPFIANRSVNTEDILVRNWISLGSIPQPLAQ